MNDSQPAPSGPAAPGPGLIDIHCHLIPGVDDGCQNFEQTLDSIRTLQAHGYVGSICTPHVWPDLYPGNTPAATQQRVESLREQLASNGIDYTLWAGGELRLREDTLGWLEQQGVPALAGSHFVLLDMWEKSWEPWKDQALDWFEQRGWQVILAHPERLAIDGLDEHLERWVERGVRLQGNFRSLTGLEGERAERRMRRYLDNGWVSFLALDAHWPDSLGERLSGVQRAVSDYGQALVDQLTDAAPRELVLGLSA